MVRVSKDPEERKQELIDAAGRLFLKKGYENTAVSDIVKEINVAQGTFYYYFNSKEEILAAFVEKIILALINGILIKADRNNIDPAARINEICNTLIRFHSNFYKLSEYIHHESNRILHEKFGRMTFERFVPVLSGVIAAGIVEGRFNVSYPTETAEFLTLGVSYYVHLNEIKDTTPERNERARITVEQSLSRVLGVKDYAFKLEQQQKLREG